MFDYRAEVKETLDHPLANTFQSDVGQPIDSSNFELGGDYPLEQQERAYGFEAIDQLLTLWNILGDKKLVKVGVVHTPPYTNSSWFLYDN